MRKIGIHGGKLYGASGGQLEFVRSYKSHAINENGKLQMLQVLLFTDHDRLGDIEQEIEPGAHYKIMVPIWEERDEHPRPSIVAWRLPGAHGGHRG